MARGAGRRMLHGTPPTVVDPVRQRVPILPGEPVHLLHVDICAAAAGRGKAGHLAACILLLHFPCCLFAFPLAHTGSTCLTPSL